MGEREAEFGVRDNTVSSWPTVQMKEMDNESCLQVANAIKSAVENGPLPSLSVWPMRHPHIKPLTSPVLPHVYLPGWKMSLHLGDAFSLVGGGRGIYECV
ncbi:Hypothetical predicted protein [Podarcis lilfordi]|uniref:Uncharacterized protein n=1 Tax=Podarcis lilfordi TaxID=74358 RepID=A0AA35LBI7_9SAUR|nr:Hypothetical predicted protein [Podarcis lilfordi]